MATINVLLVIRSPQLVQLLREEVLTSPDYQPTFLSQLDEARAVLRSQKFDVVFMEAGSNMDFTIIEDVLTGDPTCPVILISSSKDPDLIIRALRTGISDFLVYPLESSDVVNAIQAGLTRRKKLKSGINMQSGAQPDPLHSHNDGSMMMEDIGRSLTASLDLEHVLTVVVETAVKLTRAEEGSLLILDDESGELFMRAAKNFQDEFVRMFRLPVDDTLAGEVIRKKRSVILNEDTPQKIKTTYFVRDLIYVPLTVGGNVIGVLGVDNRERSNRFSQEHVSLLTTLADYAAIAIENARLYQAAEYERQKLDSILNQIEDGVVVVSSDKKVVLINRKARELFNLPRATNDERSFEDVYQHETFIDMIERDHDEMPYRSEITLDDGYTWSTQLVRIPGVGSAITMHDITYFKELDRIKTDFVNTVSHDLRSPLTAILGYIELIKKAGEVNDRQSEYITRVQNSVRRISSLINSLLELGRIESGFDTQKTSISLAEIVKFTLEDLQSELDVHHQALRLEVSSDVPTFLGDPVRLRQIAHNLISNAIQYTPDGGQINICIKAQQDQIIFQVADNGIGIPVPDQAYIFDKFYRASNTPDDQFGSGLGLAIVKSIVENYQGRVWVESELGEGSCFTVVLPLLEWENNSDMP